MGLVGLEEPGEEDSIKLKGMIEEHARLTNSELANKLLNNWQLELERFIKVIPHDYKRVLESRKEKVLKELV